MVLVCGVAFIVSLQGSPASMLAAVAGQNFGASSTTRRRCTIADSCFGGGRHVGVAAGV